MAVENQRGQAEAVRCSAKWRARRGLAFGLAELVKADAVHCKAQPKAVAPPEFECEQKVPISENIKFASASRCGDLQSSASLKGEAVRVEPGLHDAAQTVQLCSAFKEPQEPHGQCKLMIRRC